MYVAKARYIVTHDVWAIALSTLKNDNKIYIYCLNQMYL
jgi:hypothetical protein